MDAQAQIIAIAQGLGIPDPHSWTWLEPAALRLICEAIAKQAAEVTALKDQFAGLPRSRLCAELHYSLDEWKNAGAPTKDVVNAVVNLVQHGLDAS